MELLWKQSFALCSLGKVRSPFHSMKSQIGSDLFQKCIFFSVWRGTGFTPRGFWPRIKSLTPYPCGVLTPLQITYPAPRTPRGFYLVWPRMTPLEILTHKLNIYHMFIDLFVVVVLNEYRYWSNQLEKYSSLNKKMPGISTMVKKWYGDHIILFFQMWQSTM